MEGIFIMLSAGIYMNWAIPNLKSLNLHSVYDHVYPWLVWLASAFVGSRTAVYLDDRISVRIIYVNHKLIYSFEFELFFSILSRF
jgi:hypothetical protein